MRGWFTKLRRWIRPAHVPGFLFRRGKGLAFYCALCGHEVPAQVTEPIYHRWYSRPCAGCGTRYMSQPISERAPGAPVLVAGDHVTIWGGGRTQGETTMPFVRRGNVVFKKLPGGKLEKKGASKSVEKAKAYKRVLEQKSKGR